MGFGVLRILGVLGVLWVLAVLAVLQFFLRFFKVFMEGILEDLWCLRFGGCVGTFVLF